MPRRLTGEVIAREWKHGRGFALRFRAYGERRYVTLGYEGEGDPPLDEEQAEVQLANILADVRRGVWVPPPKKKKTKKKAPGKGGKAGREVVLFGPFAEGLVKDRRGQVSPRQTEYDEWALRHLTPWFADRPLPEFDVESVDAYRSHKVEEAAALAEAMERGRPRRDARGQVVRPLSAVSINKTIDVLQWVLGIAVEYRKRTGLTENPATGPKRRLVEADRRPVHLDTAEQIEALLLASADADRDPLCHCCDREAIVATLVLAGPRAHELCNLLWRDIDFINDRIYVGRSKTQAGLREIPLVPMLRRILLAHRSRSGRTGPDDLVFPTATGGRRNKDNLRKHVLELALRRADEILISRGHIPLPVGVTAHKLRHTFASLMIAIGEDPVSVQKALGHTTPNFTLRVYSHLMRRDKAERDRLKALVRGERVLAVEAPPPELLALERYERPILDALVEQGGRGRRREVVHAVGEALAGRHGTKDLECLPSGPPRWKPRIGKVFTRLERRGLIEAGESRGEWQLTEAGRVKAGARTSRPHVGAMPAEEAPVPEPRLRLVA